MRATCHRIRIAAVLTASLSLAPARPTAAAQSSKGCGCSHAPTPDASVPIWLALFGILFMAVLKRKRTRR